MTAPRTQIMQWRDAGGTLWRATVTFGAGRLDVGEVERVATDRSAAEQAPTLGQRVASYLAAEASLLMRGPTSAAVQGHRLACCTGVLAGGDRVAPACGSLRVSRSGLHCASCACGVSRRSDLRRKATMPDARCPLGRW